ncbi:DUF1707 domain-containing protein [Nocardia sp. NPDC059240]|uniref:DUF1707 SHOCT-like domain-containing protein n=1 Tax=Nocardia sp. NPDC059240 TaxID=3346786 RepID=UPI0036BE5C11
MSSRSSGTAGDAAASGRMRARDIDRVNTRAMLDAAYEEGELGVEEYHQRSERAQAAQTLGELQRLIGDLQPSAKAVNLNAAGKRVRRKAGGGYPPGTRARDSDRQAACELLDAGLADGQLSVDDHRTLTELAGGAKTLGDLAQLTDDLQRPADAPPDAEPPTSRREIWFTIGVVAASIAVAVGTFIAVDRPADRAAGPPSVDIGVIKPLVLPRLKLTEAEGLTYFRDAYRRKFGDTIVDSADLFPDYASVVRGTQPNRQSRYYYRGGFDLGTAPETRSPQTPTVDLAALDVQAIAAVEARAADLTKVPDGVVDNLDIVGTANGPLVRISVGNTAKESGYLEVTPDGRIVRTSAFGG